MSTRRVKIKYCDSKRGWVTREADLEDIINSNGDVIYIFRFDDDHIRLGHSTEIQEYLD